MSRTTGRECSEGDCLWLAPKVGAPGATSDRKPSDYECIAKTKKWPDCPRALRTQLLAWQTVFGTNQLTHARARLETAEAERDALVAEVREWLCEKCHTVFPGPPQPKCSCVICTTCGGPTKPRAVAERDALRSAMEWCAERVFQGCDIDGGDFQDEMVERGIMVSEPAPDEWKIEWDADEWFVLAWHAARGAK